MKVLFIYSFIYLFIYLFIYTHKVTSGFFFYEDLTVNSAACDDTFKHCDIVLL